DAMAGGSGGWERGCRLASVSAAASGQRTVRDIVPETHRSEGLFDETITGRRCRGRSGCAAVGRARVRAYRRLPARRAGRPCGGVLRVPHRRAWWLRLLPERPATAVHRLVESERGHAGLLSRLLRRTTR